MTEPDDALLDVRGIGKSFSGVAALTDARLRVGRAEVHALIGQNGAGKSTLIKILTGALRRDGGEIVFDGQPIAFTSPLAAQEGGISTIYQELNLVPLRSVAENVFAGREPTRFGLIDWPRVHREATDILARFGIDVDVRRPLFSCNTATQQMTAVARAVSTRAKLVIMDEPTSSLDEGEVQTLFRVIRQLKADGVSVIFVTHRLDELYAVCDRITIMRDGRTIAEEPMQALSKFDLVHAMLGRELESAESAPVTAVAADAAVLFEASGLRSDVRVKDASVQIREGEIVGLAGLLGSGRTELARCMFGADAVDGGSMAMRGRPFAPTQPADAIGAGLAYLSEDRKTEGIVPELSVTENLALVLMPTLTRWGVVDQAAIRSVALDFIVKLDIRCAGPGQKIRELSGGNQQKVLLARWLCTSIDLLLLDEPTRGIDVGAKAEILTLVRALAGQGKSILMIASELDELIAAASRIVVLRDGCTVAELGADQINEDALMTAMAEGGAGAIETGARSPARVTVD